VRPDVGPRPRPARRYDRACPGEVHLSGARQRRGGAFCGRRGGRGGGPFEVEGYEIDMGRTTMGGGGGGARPFARITSRNGQEADEPEGACLGNLWGTYIHGIFDNDTFREALLAALRTAKGAPAGGRSEFGARRGESIDALARLVGSSLDIASVMRIAGLG
ncbi:MAG: hypothetical protein ACE5GY_10115, partial [Thermodesulfobacteriota bacterium]